MKNQKGFTLIELIMVIVILGILAAVAIPKFVDLSGNAEASACKANQASIESAMALAYAENAASGTPGFPADYADASYYASGSVPTCPSGGTYTYTAASGTISCDQATHAR